MGGVNRLGGPRLGWEATPRAVKRERVAGFVLLCLFLGLALLLVGACNMQGFPPPPPPGTEGVIADCPMGTLPEKLYNCIPPSLGVTDCASLVGQPCDQPNMLCESEIGTLCACEPGDAGFIWSCVRFGDPPP